MSTSMSTCSSRPWSPRTGSESTQSPPTSAGSSLVAGIANLLNTVVGAGILSLPCFFRFPAASQLVWRTSTSSAVRHGSWLLLDALRSCPSCLSYEELPRRRSPRRRHATTPPLTSTATARASYLVVAGDILPPLLHESGIGIGRPTVLTALTPCSSSCSRRCAGPPDQYASASPSAFTCLRSRLALASDSARAAGAARARPGCGRLDPRDPACAFAYLHQTSLFPIIQEAGPPRRRAAEARRYGDRAVHAHHRRMRALWQHRRGRCAAQLGDGRFRSRPHHALVTSPSALPTCLHYQLGARSTTTFGRVGQQTPHRRLLALTAALVGSSLGVALVVRRVEPSLASLARSPRR